METRANYLLVGSFVLALALGLILFLAWIAKVELGDHQQHYRIFFTGSITGLKDGSPVRYRGVPVGSVSQIRINPDNVEEIQVDLRINPEVPIKTDTVAALEMLGITGNAYVQLSGGTQAAAWLQAKGDQPPVIASRSSPLTEVFEAAPQLMHRLVEIGDRLNRILSPENERLVTASLGNLHQMSQDLATAAGKADATMSSIRNSSAGIDTLVQDLRGHTETLSTSLNQTLGQVRQSLGALDQTASTGLDQIVRTGDQVRQLSGSLKQLSDQLAGLIQENRVPVRDFTGVGLYELSQLIVELRELAVSLSRVSNQIERSPVQFLFNGSQQQPQPQEEGKKP